MLQSANGPWLLRLLVIVGRQNPPDHLLVVRRGSNVVIYPVKINVLFNIYLYSVSITLHVTYKSSLPFSFTTNRSTTAAPSPRRSLLSVARGYKIRRSVFACGVAGGCS